MSERYAIGIDLGTTHSSVALIDLDKADSKPELLPLRQWETSDQAVVDVRLPSFLWMLPKGLLKKGLRPHPSNTARAFPWSLGREAREQALTSPLEVIHSAKSWLSTGSVEQRTSRILPWGSEGEKLSPVETQTAILEHVREEWDHASPGSPFGEQRIIITVPASFDELAQRLTLEAARRAGYPDHVELLEEPLAAYYDWEAMNRSQSGTILVCDIGGGTSDFTLLKRTATGTERLRVSDHLLLGGDNIDLALTHRLSRRLSPEELPRSGWNLLLAQTRRLKEDALRESDDLSRTFHISVPLDGARLFGRYLSADVTAEDLRLWVLEDFFPEVKGSERPQHPKGLHSWGLPYAKDTAITRHLAEFLDGERVDALLCAGGTLIPACLTARLAATVGAWQSGSPVALLEHPESDLAIASGAARFGALRARAQTLVHSPYPRDLMIEVESPNGPQQLCLIPKGHPRREPFAVQTSGLYLRLGQEVCFQIHAIQGDGSRHALAPLVLKLGDGKGRDLIPVRLEAAVRETGTLEVSCHALVGDLKWTLDFSIEGQKANPSSPESVEAEVDVPRLEDARAMIREFYLRQNQGRLHVGQLPQALEDLWKAPRDQWSAAHLRGLWLPLETVMFQRQISPEHEAIWFYLAGFCLRPGFGYRADPERMRSLLRIYDESFRRVDGNAKTLMHWWILWRRLAGGLETGFQQKLFDRYMPVLRREREPSPELLRLLASLERIDRGSKEQLGRLLLTQLKEGVKTNADTRLWALARLASRYPVYASARHVLPPRLVESWADDLGTITFNGKVRPDLFYAWAGRLRGDKQYDIDPPYREAFISRLDNPEWKKALSEVIAMDAAVQSQMLGDDLPSGFIVKV